MADEKNSADVVPSPSPSRSLPRNVIILGIASLLNDIATEMAYPVLATILKSTIVISWVEGLADTVAALLKLFSGTWSDRWGARRSFVLFGYGLACFARPFMGAATATWQFVTIRTVDRIGKGLRASPRDAMIADSVPAEQRGRAFGFHQALDHLGAAIGPLLAFAFLYYYPGQFSTLFWLTAIPGAAIILLLLLGLKNPPQKTAAGKTVRLSLQPFDSRFKRYLLAVLCFALGNSSDMLLLKRAETFGVSLPLIWCGFHLAKSLGNYLCGRLVDRHGPFPSLLVGWVLYGGVYLGFATLDSATAIWCLFAVYAVHYSLSEPAEKALAVVLAGQQHKGLALGWFNFVTGILVLPANLLTGLLYNSHGPLVAFGTCAGFTAVAILLLTTVRPRS